MAANPERILDLAPANEAMPLVVLGDVDFVTVLRSKKPLTKTWKQDGTIGSYSNALIYTVEERHIESFNDLRMVLSGLENEANACVIRGKLRNDWLDILSANLPVWNADRIAGGKTEIILNDNEVLRRKDLFADAPHRWCMVDIDGFPMIPGESVESAIERYLKTIDGDMAVTQYYYQLSSSFGHPTKEGILKAHLWFWLDRKLTSAELKRWGKGVNSNNGQNLVDVSLYDEIQIHYTAKPIFDGGVTKPDIERSGLYESFQDELTLVIPEVHTESKVTRESGASSRNLKDPRHKSGIIGAFHRAYAIEEVIDRFVPDEFVWVDKTRLTWSGGSGAVGGVFIREDRQGLGANHASWPWGVNTVCNKWDLVRHFKFGHLDNRNTALDPTKSASQDAMMDWAKSLSEVNAELIEEGAKAFHLTTDQANADRILRNFGSKMMVAGGRWYLWAGTHWKLDTGDGIKYALGLSRLIEAEAVDYERRHATSSEDADANKKIAEGLRKWGKASESKKSLDAAIGLVRKQICVEPDELDSDPFALNCLNGTVDLRTGSIKQHNPDDRITRLLTISYDPKAKAQTWERVISEITLEDNLAKKPLAGFLQRWFGYCATASTREQKFAVHWGSGSNGKSTIIGTIESVLGPYASTAPPGLMEATKHERHPTEIAGLFGQRMVTAHESEDGAVLREGFIKQATGDDTLKGRYMRQDFFDFRPTHKLQLLTQHKPVIKGQDDGIWRRVMLIPYLAVFGDAVGVCDPGQSKPATHVKNKGLVEQLRGESEGVLAWLVRGAVDWYAAGLNPPDIVLEASREYKSEQDKVGHFIHELCELGPDKKAVVKRLYDAYMVWTRENGYTALGKMRFLNRLENSVKGFRTAKEKAPNPLTGGRKTTVFAYGIGIDES